MNNVTILLMQILLSCVVYTIVAVWYVWPSLTNFSRNSALIPLLFVHVMRYSGMTTLVTGMIDPNLPREFLSNAAYGDLLAAALALASIFALGNNSRVAVPLVWVFTAWGFLDMLNGLNTIEQHLSVERSELQPRYLLVYLHFLRSLSSCYTFDDHCDFGQV